MDLVPVIGLELHVQLKTKSKMFCGCDNRGEFLPPNTAVCPVCLGHPGTLPVLNLQALKYAILIGRALGCQVNAHCKFDRKHYFYPDLPKGYQITQFDEPIVGAGVFSVEIPGVDVPRAVAPIGTTRAHLEEDAAKSFHGQNKESLVDFNRGGTPLLEIVTEPDFQTPLEAKTFLQELRLLLRALDVSDADMEKGHLRCDANISLRRADENKLYPKTEIKNINSFRAVERALQHEITRQTALWEAGTPPTKTTTRGWDDMAGKTTEQRVKEGADDYRYFPEPDIPPLDLTDLIKEMSRELPELPTARRRRLQTEYKFSVADARHLVENPELADYAEDVMSELLEWLRTENVDTEENVWREKAAKLVSGWLLTKYTGALNEAGRLFTAATITAENFAEFLTMIYRQQINSTTAQLLLRQMITSGGDPSQILETENLAAADDTSLNIWVDEVIAEFPLQVAQFQSGKTAVLQFLLGQIMKKARGTADPNTLRELLENKLK